MVRKNVAAWQLFCALLAKVFQRSVATGALILATTLSAYSLITKDELLRIYFNFLPERAIITTHHDYKSANERGSVA